MTVKELITKLEQEDENKLVVVPMHSAYTEEFDVTAATLQAESGRGWYNHIFPSLPHQSSRPKWDVVIVG